MKIFQKGDSFNKYTEPNLASVTPNADEITPFFVIYDCNKDDGCVQTSGFVKYIVNGGDGSNEFVNCYTQNHISITNDGLTDMSTLEHSVIGCIKLFTDGSTESCNSNYGLKPAASGTCKFTSPDFSMCANLKVANIDNTDSVESSDYGFKTISMTIGEGQFLYTNGLTPFPNTLKNGKVLLKISSDYAVLNKRKKNTLSILYFLLYIYTNV